MTNFGKSVNFSKSHQSQSSYLCHELRQLREIKLNAAWIFKHTFIDISVRWKIKLILTWKYVYLEKLSTFVRFQIMQNKYRFLTGNIRLESNVDHYWHSGNILTWSQNQNMNIKCTWGNNGDQKPSCDFFSSSKG